jgi:RNA ligase (TIGR02306 family)
MRKLASIRRIGDIRPIPGADAIECARVDGWEVVVKKGEFQTGDLAVYIEIDAWVPHALVPFLTRGDKIAVYEQVPGARLRTMTLRGQLSQGLLLPLGNLSGEAGTDVTEALGVLKWEMPIPAQLAGQVRGAFPSRVPRTEQERAQNLAESEILAHCPYEVTEKLDGASCTFHLDSEAGFHVCSRNLDLCRDENNTLWKIALEHAVEARMAGQLLLDTAIQGEVIGPGIQGNHYNVRTNQFHVFDIYRAGAGEYLPPDERVRIARDLGLPHAPVLAAKQDCATIAEALALARGLSALIDKPREGVVLKSLEGQRYSFKAINNDFLLKKD